MERIDMDRVLLRRSAELRRLMATLRARLKGLKFRDQRLRFAAELSDELLDMLERFAEANPGTVTIEVVEADRTRVIGYAGVGAIAGAAIGGAVAGLGGAAAGGAIGAAAGAAMAHVRITVDLREQPLGGVSVAF